MMKIRHFSAKRFPPPSLSVTLAGLSVSWLALIVASPLAAAPVSLLAYAAGGVLCHQIAERSMHIDGAQLAVCARCTGIYAGAAFVLLTLAVRSSGKAAASGRRGLVDAIWPARLWLLAGVLPTGLTVLLEDTGLSSVSNLQRAAAGVCLGAALGLVAGRAATLHLHGAWPSERTSTW
jgi:uncharacterized membrane protein